MDLQTYVTNAVAVQRAEQMKTSPQLTLGELILKIEPVAEKNRGKGENEATVRYDFEYLFPTRLDSWRGSYCELALNFGTVGDEMKVTAFLEMLRSAVGRTFQGYKGGEYMMGKTTPVWVANYGNSGNTAVVGIIDNDYQIIIETRYCEYG